MDGLTWIEFALYVRGLLAANTRLNRHFQPKRRGGADDER